MRMLLSFTILAAILVGLPLLSQGTVEFIIMSSAGWAFGRLALFLADLLIKKGR